MQCERLIKQIKGWFLHVQNETMAPARMIGFIEDHANHCDTCLADPDLQEEIARITEIVLPDSKIPKAVRLQQEQAEEEAASEEKEKEEKTGEEDEETSDEENEDEDEDIFEPDDEI